jgi:DNA-binding response OmpR family regulator
MKVLLVEDDRKLQSFLSRALVEEGCAVDACRTGPEALRQLGSIKYDLVVLDWMLPEQDGLSVCRDLRRQGNQTPVLMLTARNEVGEKVMGLDAGADDYVTKPFHLDELMARVRALLRRADGTQDGVVRAGPIVIDHKERRVHADGLRVELTSRELALLSLLVRNARRVVTRSEILAHVWETHSDPGSNVIDVHMRNLRDKLGASAQWLKTVRGRGYRFALADPS